MGLYVLQKMPQQQQVFYKPIALMELKCHRHDRLIEMVDKRGTQFRRNGTKLKEQFPIRSVSFSLKFHGLSQRTPVLSLYLH